MAKEIVNKACKSKRKRTSTSKAKLPTRKPISGLLKTITTTGLSTEKLSFKAF